MIFSITRSHILHTYTLKKKSLFMRKSNLTRHLIYLFTKPGTTMMIKWKFCLGQQYEHRQTLDHDWSKSIVII